MKKKLKSSKNSLKKPTEYLKTLANQSDSSTTKKGNLWNAKNVVDYAELKLGIKLDDWQKKYIETEGNTAARCGRQSGKSFAEALRVALFALLHPKTQTLIIGAVDRQSAELFEKVKSMLILIAGKQNIVGRPTMHEVKLKNGSKIIAHPAGRTGYGLRGYAINKLVVDEAHYVPEEVYVAVRPMLATTGGTIDLLSTPRGNEGFFYDCFFSDEFATFHVLSRDCPRISEEFLESERKRMTKLQFKQEYEAEFLDQVQQFFPKELIDSVTGLNLFSRGNYYLGVDVARYGGDENAFVVVREWKDKLMFIKYETTENITTTDTIGRIRALNHQYNFKKIYIDDGGIGGSVLDVLLDKGDVKYKVVGINNASRSVDKENKHKRILKEDLYGNLKRLMEQKQIILPDDEKLRLSLMSIQFEYTTDTDRVKIYGKYSHITEALIRAAWCVYTKGLNIMAFC